MATAPERFGWPLWLAVLSAVVAVHWLLFAVVHNLVDMRPCTTHLADPLFRLIPPDPRWTLVTVDAYSLFAAAIVLTLFWQAVRGAEFPILRLGIGLSVSSLLRGATLLLVPLCRADIALGTRGPVASIPLHDPRFLALGLRGFATNDLLFSGHTAFFLLMFFVTARWPRPVRGALAAFIVVMICGLLSTREHYTVDILLAIPCSVFADRVALALLQLARRMRPGRT